MTGSKCDCRCRGSLEGIRQLWRQSDTYRRPVMSSVFNGLQRSIDGCHLCGCCGCCCALCTAVDDAQSSAVERDKRNMPRTAARRMLWQRLQQSGCCGERGTPVRLITRKLHHRLRPDRAWRGVDACCRRVIAIASPTQLQRDVAPSLSNYPSQQPAVV